MQQQRSSLRSLPIVLVLLAIVLSCGDIDADELQCEEAAARLESCCETPKVDARRFNCLKENAQSCNASLTPAFTDQAYECLSNKSCADIVGACEAFRRLSLQPYQFQDPSAIQAEACR